MTVLSSARMNMRFSYFACQTCQDTPTYTTPMTLEYYLHNPLILKLESLAVQLSTHDRIRRSEERTRSKEIKMTLFMKSSIHVHIDVHIILLHGHQTQHGSNRCFSRLPAHNNLPLPIIDLCAQKQLNPANKPASPPLPLPFPLPPLLPSLTVQYPFPSLATEVPLLFTLGAPGKLYPMLLAPLAPFELPRLVP